MQTMNTQRLGWGCRSLAIVLCAIGAQACSGDHMPIAGDGATDEARIDGGSLDGAMDGAMDGGSLDGSPDGTVATDARDGATQDSADAHGEFCSGSGPLILVGDQPVDGGVPGGRCAGSLAATTFRFALCTCDGLVTSHDLTTDAFDSATGASVGGVAGSVGTNGMLNVGGSRMQIGGSLWVSSATGIASSAPSVINGELYCGGTLGGSASVRVGMAASVAGNVSVSDITVGGVLTLPAGAVISDPTPTAASIRRADVRVDPPCDCAASRRPTLSAFLSRYRSTNDNAAIGLRADRFTNVTGSESLDLPCGRYSVDSILGPGSLAVRVRGRVALFVQGDVSLNGSLSFALDPGAELDVFVGGNVNAAGALDFGSRMTPARVRVYVAGTGTINLSGGSVFAGNLYAPDAEIVTAGALEVYGAIFARRLAAGGAVTIHYDTAVLREGERCDPMTPGDGGAPDGSVPGQGCGSCRDCDNQACVAGRCGACTTSAECCAPLQCWNGRCIVVPG